MNVELKLNTNYSFVKCKFKSTFDPPGIPPLSGLAKHGGIGKTAVKGAIIYYLFKTYLGLENKRGGGGYL